MRLLIPPRLVIWIAFNRSSQRHDLPFSQIWRNSLSCCYAGLKLIASEREAVCDLQNAAHGPVLREISLSTAPGCVGEFAMWFFVAMWEPEHVT